MRQNNKTNAAPVGTLPINERYGVTVPVAATYIGISRSRLYELLAAGELEGRIIHGRRIVLVQSLLRMCGEAPSAKRGDVGAQLGAMPPDNVSREKVVT